MLTCDCDFPKVELVRGCYCNILRRRDCAEAIVLVMAEEGASSCPDSAPKGPRADSHRELCGAKTGERSDKKSPMCFDAMLRTYGCSGLRTGAQSQAPGRWSPGQ